MLASLSRRLVAATIALILSGAPRLAASAAGEPAAPPCRCHHAHDATPCDCPARAAARRSEAKDVPACHRSARGRTGGTERSAAPGVKGSCGAPEASYRSTASGADTYLLPGEAAPEAIQASRLRHPATAIVLALAREPEIPPPRA